jgi:hypothetical protein
VIFDAGGEWCATPAGRRAVAARGIQDNPAGPFAPGAINARRSSQDDLNADPCLLCETFCEFDQNTPVGGVLDFSEGDDQPQSFDDIQVDLIVAKQLQQFVPGVIGIVDIHRTRSGRS